MKKGMIFIGFLLFSLLIAVSPDTLYADSNSVVPFVAEFFIGGTLDGKWVDSDMIATSVPAGLEFRCYSFSKETERKKGTAPELEQGPGEYWNISFGSTETELENTFKVGGNWNALPRLPKLQKGGFQAYEKEIAAILKKNDISAPVVIQQLVRIDLDGNGTDEVILVAGNANSRIPMFEKNTYSIVLFRALVNGKVQTSILHEHFYKEAREGEADSPNGYEIPFVLDLNNDGKMEVILRGAYYEGFWYEIFEFDGKSLISVLSNGIGA